MKNRRKKLIIAILPLVAVPVLVLLAELYMSEFKKFMFPCPAWIMGFYCPGCGGTRCISSLLNGDFLAALKYNPLVLGGILLLFLLWLENVLSLLGRDIKIVPKSRIFAYTLLGIVIIYTILRNIFPILSSV